MAPFAHFDAAAPLRDALCISAFLISARGDRLLAGRTADHPRWPELDSVPRDLSALADRWVLPAAHLRLGEDPGDAARRIAADQLEAGLEEATLSAVLSYAAPQTGREQDLHWDLCFAFAAKIALDGTPPWFAELAWIPLAELEDVDFARGHDDILRSMELLPARGGEG